MKHYKVKCDSATTRWFNKHVGAETTVTLGHKCKIKKEKNNDDPKTNVNDCWKARYLNKPACDFCSNDDDTYLLKQRGTLSLKDDFYPGINMYIAGDELWVDAVADVYESNFMEEGIKINYCPMCGRRLSD